MQEGPVEDEKKDLEPSSGSDVERRQEEAPEDSTKINPETVAQLIASKSFSGPLPPPDLLEHYQRIQPDLAERIIRLTEREAEHRHRIESSVIQSDADATHRGQKFGLAIAIMALGVAGLALLLGHGAAAVVIGGTTVVSLAAVFVIGRWPGRSNEQEDQE